MKNSSIQWCDHTFNAWEGCTKVAPECKNCYAEVLTDHRFGRVKWGKGQPRRRTSAAYWKQPLAWDRLAASCGQNAGAEQCPVCSGPGGPHRPRVFCLSLGDWLDEEVPIEWLADLMDVVYTTFNLDWLLLTKRPQNFRDRLAKCINSTPYLRRVWIEKWIDGDPPPNVWIGVSAGADQRAALQIPAKIHFLSCEPMLKPLDTNFLPTQEFDWIIFGGESGKNARLCWVHWIRDGIAFCRRNGIAPFVKQLGANVGGDEIDKWVARLTDSHGGDMAEWSEDLRVREFPNHANSSE